MKNYSKITTHYKKVADMRTAIRCSVQSVLSLKEDRMLKLMIVHQYGSQPDTNKMRDDGKLINRISQQATVYDMGYREYLNALGFKNIIVSNFAINNKNKISELRRN